MATLAEKKQYCTGPNAKKHFFSPVAGRTDYYHCRSCGTDGKSYKQTRKAGNQNLLSHLEASHKDEWKDELVKVMKEGMEKGPMYAFIPQTATPKAVNLYGWLIQCVQNDEPFAFVENNLKRKYSSLKPICTKTLIKYLELLGGKVEEE